MLRKIALLALLGASACAQDRVVPLLLLNTDPQALVASVISANPSTTEYLVGCPTGVDSNDCGYNPPATVKHAGSVYAASLTAPDQQFTMSWECTVGSASAVCTTSAGGAQANFPGTETATVAASEIPTLSVTVTAGADLLADEPTSAAGVSASSSGVASATANSAPTAGVGLGLADALMRFNGLVLWQKDLLLMLRSLIPRTILKTRIDDSVHKALLCASKPQSMINLYSQPELGNRYFGSLLQSETGLHPKVLEFAVKALGLDDAWTTSQLISNAAGLYRKLFRNYQHGSLPLRTYPSPMPIQRRVCQDLSHSSRRLAQNPLWITDDVLDEALHRFLKYSRGAKRYGSNVPGPLEAQRRLARRKMMGLASVGHAPAIDPAALFGFGGPQLGKMVWQAPTEQSTQETRIQQRFSRDNASVSWLEKLGLSQGLQPAIQNLELSKDEETEDSVLMLVRIHHSTPSHASWLKLRERFSTIPIAELRALALKAEEWGLSRDKFCKDAFRAIAWERGISWGVLDFMINPELNRPEAHNLTRLVSIVRRRSVMTDRPEVLNKLVFDCLKLGLVYDGEIEALIRTAFTNHQTSLQIDSKSNASSTDTTVPKSLVDAIWNGLRACPIRSETILPRAASLILELLPATANLIKGSTRWPAFLFELYKHAYPTRYDQKDAPPVGAYLAEWATQACSIDAGSRMSMSTFTNILVNLHPTIITRHSLVVATKLLMRRYETSNIDQVHDVHAVLIGWLTCLQRALAYNIWSPLLGLVAQRAVSPLDLADVFSLLAPSHHLTCEALLTHWIPRLPVYQGNLSALKQRSLQYDDSSSTQQRSQEIRVTDIKNVLTEYRALHKKTQKPRNHDSFAFLLIVLFRHSKGSTLSNQQLILSLAERLLGAAAVADICNHARSAGVYIHPQPIADVVQRIVVKQPRVALSLWKSRKLNVPDMQTFLCSMIADGVPSVEIFRILCFTNTYHHLPLEQRQNEKNALTPERIELFHQCADAFSRQSANPRIVMRDVQACYLQLKARHAPFTPVMSRALVRAGIINYLQARINVSQEQVKWVVQMVEEIEGQEVARVLEQLVSRWLRKVYARWNEERQPQRLQTERLPTRLHRLRNGALKGQKPFDWQMDRDIFPRRIRRYLEDGTYRLVKVEQTVIQ